MSCYHLLCSSLSSESGFLRYTMKSLVVYDSLGIYGTVYQVLISSVFLSMLNFLLLLLPSHQVFLNLLALLALHGVGLIHLKPFSLRLGERLFVPAVCGSVQCVLAIWAEACSHSGLYPLIARFLPMVSVSLGHLFALSIPGSIHVSCLLTVLTFASVTVTACKGLHAMDPLEYVFSPLSLVLHSLSLAWLAKVSQTERGHTSTFDLYYTLTVTRTLLLGFLCVLHPDGPKALIHGNWHSLLFLGYMLGMLLLGAVQLLFVDVTALYFSALPAAVLHATRGLVLPLFSLL
ncbi:uncharacterized protein [Sinocyclocheilus grahami]|nr:PREDICTED: uncharacterized protein LOC107553886 [Sinocyclocheilus grahami]